MEHETQKDQDRLCVTDCDEAFIECVELGRLTCHAQFEACHSDCFED